MIAVEAIASLVICTRCLRHADGIDPDCERCGGIAAGLRWRNDPVSYDGCEPEPEGATIMFGEDGRGSFEPGVGA